MSFIHASMTLRDYRQNSQMELFAVDRCLWHLPPLINFTELCEADFLSFPGERFVNCYKDLGPTLMTSVYFQNARIDLVACWRLLNILARTDMMGSVDWQHWLRNRWGLLSRSTFWQIQRIPRGDCGWPEWPSRWNLLKRDQHSDRKTVGVTSWQGDAFGRKG